MRVSEDSKIVGGRDRVCAAQAGGPTPATVARLAARMPVGLVAGGAGAGVVAIVAVTAIPSLPAETGVDVFCFPFFYSFFFLSIFLSFLLEPRMKCGWAEQKWSVASGSLVMVMMFADGFSDARCSGETIAHFTPWAHRVS